MLAAARDGQETLLSAPLEAQRRHQRRDGGPRVPRPARGSGPPAQRRAALRGFVSATVSVPAFARRRPRASRRASACAWRTRAPPPRRRSGPGSTWRGATWPSPSTASDGSSKLVPVAVALGGLLLAGVVALLFVESAGRERTARGELATPPAAARPDPVLGGRRHRERRPRRPRPVREPGRRADAGPQRRVDRGAARSPTPACPPPTPPCAPGARSPGRPRSRAPTAPASPPSSPPRRSPEDGPVRRRHHVPRRHRAQAAGGADAREPGGGGADGGR